MLANLETKGVIRIISLKIRINWDNPAQDGSAKDQRTSTRVERTGSIMRMEDCGKREKTGELSYERQKMLEEEERKIVFYVNCATSLNTNREDKLLNSAL